MIYYLTLWSKGMYLEHLRQLVDVLKESPADEAAVNP